MPMHVVHQWDTARSASGLRTSAPSDSPIFTHLNTDDLDGLVPGTEGTTDGRGEDLVAGGELVVLAETPELANVRLGKTGETETRSPVGGLADGDGVDTLVDALDALTLVNVGKDLEGGLGGGTAGGLLVARDLDRLHACAEA